MKKRKKLMFMLLALALIFTFAACEQEIVQTNQKVSINSSVKRFDGRGVVTKLDVERGSVELDHEEIKGSMPAMIMEFYVTDKRELENLKVGDQVEFVLEEDRGQEKLTSIKKIQ
jgi:Cu/Ag efflux protein CusF